MFAPRPGFSQLAASFFAGGCLGIPHVRSLAYFLLLIPVNRITCDSYMSSAKLRPLDRSKGGAPRLLLLFFVLHFDLVSIMPISKSYAR